MIIDFEQLSANKRYHLLTQTVIPRPIAWVLSENEDRSYNLAPFSFFNALCSEPAILALSIGKKTSGARKDTAVNLLSGRPFTIHIANAKQAEQLTASAAELAYGESELLKAGLDLADFGESTDGFHHRLTVCDIAFHCHLYDHHLLGPNQQVIVYAEVKSLYLSEHVASKSNERITVTANEVNPLARLGASQYAAIGQSFSIKRPD